jgi:hypothetical protein
VKKTAARNSPHHDATALEQVILEQVILEQAIPEQAKSNRKDERVRSSGTKNTLPHTFASPPVMARVNLKTALENSKSS